MWQRLGSVMIVLGSLMLAWAALWQLGLVPGSRVTLPAPVALEASGRLRDTSNVRTPEPAAPPQPAVDGTASAAPAPDRRPRRPRRCGADHRPFSLASG